MVIFKIYFILLTISLNILLFFSTIKLLDLLFFSYQIKIDLLFLSRLSFFLIKLNIEIINILDLELTAILNIIIIKYISFDYLRILSKKKIFSKNFK